MTKQSFCLLGLMCILPLSAQVVQDVEVLRGTTVDHLARASTDRMQTSAMVREVHIRVPFPRGGSLNGILLLVQDTASHRFWWSLTSAGERLSFTLADWFVANSALYVAEDKMVVFWVQAPGRIFLIERSGLMASNLDEAQQQAIGEIQKRRADIERGGEWFNLGGTTVPLPSTRFPMLFWNPRWQAALVGVTKVVSASREGRNWRLVLRNQWDQEVILDDLYAFVSTRRLSAPEGR